ncbi:ABC transporter ATP-binding protein [Croceitalea sp. MTPC5]|uniref:ATP-binding cassette domain-containing protein n=1 Tax=Flagellimonas sediminis TaxID=2696468 RepID=A0A6I5KXK3_9FLAO|nr:ATP-binding cassette domain-containing protein [Allomuricauda sediminis]NDV44685.1 ATP-binding cassette domain-containing protein [Allomuricauda sediminis]GMN07378.1 ABC transporter ATP-binding protein [Croceitalea sp. MTPC5]|tara:strand:- start:243 stop:923 length:681 start_codon:yes stop_codon:yes gene_type:complete
MIKIERLSKFYGKKQVLNSIDLEFKKGKIYGIVGENGAGKTTLFRCISGLESYKGNILSDFTELKDHLGLLLTEPYFFSKITGKEYIQLLANARQTEITKIENKNIFGLPLNQYASTYSTGMKKKLALTAILLQENNVFILDEPFNGVDIQSNLIITEIIKRFKKLEKTVIISSHIFSTLENTCDEIYLMKNGEIINKVEKADFKNLEKKMKEFTVGNKIDKLELK